MPSRRRLNSISSACFLLLCLALAACSGPSPAAATTPISVTEINSIPASQTAFQPAQPAANATPTAPDEPTLRPTIPEPTQTPAPTAIEAPTPIPSVTFAVIGDYGSGDHNALNVANLVKSWQPDFIITVGDNNYPVGAAETIDQNIGQFYHDYIYSYQGQFGPGASEQRFFPVLGNHDLDTDHGQPYLDYFSLPGNERYYDFTWGPVHFFALNSDWREPDGVNGKSVQAQWLQERLEASVSTWNVVYMHAPPYSSGHEGPIAWMQWPFAEWGADIALAGHDHDYERLLVDGFPYIINGLGGGAIYDFGNYLAASQKRYNGGYGALLAVAGEAQITFQFITVKNEIIDSFTLFANP